MGNNRVKLKILVQDQSWKDPEVEHKYNTELEEIADNNGQRLKQLNNYPKLKISFNPKLSCSLASRDTYILNS